MMKIRVDLKRHFWAGTLAGMVGTIGGLWTNIYLGAAINIVFVFIVALSWEIYHRLVNKRPISGLDILFSILGGATMFIAARVIPTILYMIF